MKSLFPLITVGILSACSEATVQPISQNSFQITTPDAQTCGLGRSREIAFELAAVQTIRQGADRFLILSENSNTNLGGISIIRESDGILGRAPVIRDGKIISDDDDRVTGIDIDLRTDQTMLVRTLQPGEPGFETGLSARTVLGPNWQQKVAEGGSTSCFG